jgi:hypothetical protein
MAREPGLPAALGIELGSDLLCCRKVILGAIEGNNRHSMPNKGGVTRPQAVGQINGFSCDIAENRPWNLLASKGEPATMGGFGIGPKSATPSALEKVARLMSTPLLFPLAVRERMNVISFGKGSLRLRIKSVGE